MSTTEINNWLQEGISAVKAGKRKEARLLLLKVLEQDDQNEKAWLWLSGAVESVEDRRVCLQNVLTLNPNNKTARKGLAKLDEAPNATPEARQAADNAVEPETAASETAVKEQIIVRREYEPLSTASAILYPDSHIKEWEWRDPTPDHKAAKIEFESEEKRDDVWSRNVDICAYCAHEVDFDAVRCPRCKHNLITRYYRYPKASTHLTAYWVLVLGMAQIYLLWIIFHVLAERNLARAVLDGILLTLFLGWTVGIVLRKFWAHVGVIISLLVILVGAVTGFLVPADLTALGLSQLDPAIRGFLEPATSGLGVGLRTFQIAGALFGLFYGIFKAGPDFDRVQVRQIASLSKGLSDAGAYHDAAKRLARAGLWASAIMHWQRAAAHEPHQIIYQRHLGQAYARLGFYERSLDVLKTAVARSTHPAMQTEIQRLIQTIQQQREEQEAHVEST